MEKFFNKVIFFINIVLILCTFYFFTILAGKYYLRSKNFKVSEFLFKITGIKKGYFLSLIENKKFDKAKKMAESIQNPEYKGLVSWVKNDFNDAVKNFKECGNKKYLSYAYYKDGKIKEAKESLKESGDIILESHLMVDENNYEEATGNFLKNKDYSGLFKVFLKLKNFPTAVYYLLKIGNPSINIIANLFLNKELQGKIDLPSDFKKSEFENWVEILSGKISELKASRDIPSQKELLSYIYFLQGDLIHFFSELPPSMNHFLQSLLPILPEKDSSSVIEKLSGKYSDLKIYSIVPERVEVNEFNTTYLVFFAIGLVILIVVFSVSLFYLYRKYQANLIIQRSKDLEKMDALSIAKIEQMEAKKKRDKTELNVSSFVTLNIQLEVLDLAYSKLGIRVNPSKLQEQLEQTKIPNISYKIYTISNSYGLNVKMLSIKPDELIKQKQNGAVVLVLKGDLIALLKNADSQNAYLQFSQKDSRKVPFNALKLSWEGNIILLNKI